MGETGKDVQIQSAFERSHCQLRIYDVGCIIESIWNGVQLNIQHDIHIRCDYLSHYTGLPSYIVDEYFVKKLFKGSHQEIHGHVLNYHQGA